MKNRNVCVNCGRQQSIDGKAWVDCYLVPWGCANFDETGEATYMPCFVKGKGDKTETAEQRARDILDRMEIEGAQNFSAGELVELANAISGPSGRPSIKMTINDKGDTTLEFDEPSTLTTGGVFYCYREGYIRQPDIDHLKFLINSVVDSLPGKRDWLDPDIEKAMRKISSISTPQVIAPKIEIAQELENMRAYAEEIKAWEAKGENLVSSNRFGLWFIIGAWWADRPWRKRK